MGNIDLLGGIGKIVQAPFKLLGSTLYTTTAIVTGDNNGIKKGASGMINSVWDVADGVLDTGRSAIDATGEMVTGFRPGDNGYVTLPIEEKPSQLNIIIEQTPAPKPENKGNYSEYIKSLQENTEALEQNTDALNRNTDALLAQAKENEKAKAQEVSVAPEQNAPEEEHDAQKTFVAFEQNAPKPTFWDNVKNHFKNNWGKYLLAGTALAGGILLFKKAIMGLLKHRKMQ